MQWPLISHQPLCFLLFDDSHIWALISPPSSIFNPSHYSTQFPLIPSTHRTLPVHMPINMLNNGAVAVAIVRRQVMLVQTARTHTKRDKYIDVQTYSPFGERVFLASETPSARIAASDILSVFGPSAEAPFLDDSPGMIELPPQAFSEYLAHSERQQKQYEDMWCAWTAKH